MDRREDQYKDRSRDSRSGNRDMGQSRESMYRGAYRFDDHRTTRDQYGEVHDRHRDDRGQADQRNTWGSTPNYGSMGSYGGAQGYGSSRGGYGHAPQHRSGFDATSGHGHDDRYRPQANRPIYGGYWDRNSFNENDRDRFSQTHRHQHQERNRYNQYDQGREDDSRYEIYDTHQRQFNEGSYNNDVRVTPSYDFNRELHEGRGYGSHQRAKHRQGSGYDQDRRYTSDWQEGNMAGPMSGQVRRRDHPDTDDYRRNDRSRPRGGYDANNMNPDERHINR
jgi:hypothetical protein